MICIRNFYQNFPSAEVLVKVSIMEFGLNCAALFVGVAGMHFVSFTQAKQQRPKEGVTTQG